MNDDTTDDPKSRPALVSLSERRGRLRKAQDDEWLLGLELRLEERAKAAEAAGDHETAVEMEAASHAVAAASNLQMALCEMDLAHEAWEKLKRK
jgi:hypothetical protein